MIIQVEPQKLEQGALRIEQQSSLYEKSYQRLLQNVEAIKHLPHKSKAFARILSKCMI